MKGKRILIVEPHPDDTAIMAGGTVAKMSAEGSEIMVVTVTDGERGTMDRNITSSDVLRRITRKEAETASRLVNIQRQVFLGYTNHDVTFEVERELKYKILAIIRDFKPNIVMTYDPYVNDEPNPDHRTVSFATYDAVTFSHYHLEHLPEENEIATSFIVDEIWFFNTAKPNYEVDVTSKMEDKLSYMACYRSQMDSMITEVTLRLSSAGYTSKLLESGSYMDILKGLFIDSSMDNGRLIERFRIVRPFISERVPHLIRLGFVQPNRETP